jgi:hypothetical protein
LLACHQAQQDRALPWHQKAQTPQTMLPGVSTSNV